MQFLEVDLHNCNRARLDSERKPTIFVPYPFAAEDHQTVNAQRLVDKDAAMIIKDSDAQARLFGAITDLAFNEAKQEKFKKHISEFAIRDADVKIAEEILGNS